MDRFEDMRCFVQVVDRGSVTGAAEALGVAPSAVSRRLKELEARLGAQLLQRTTRRMSVTEAGRAYHAHCQRILADLDEAEAEVSSRASALNGTLRVAAPVSFGAVHLTPLLIDFMRDQPGVTLDVDFSDRIVDLVAEGFDLAVRIGALRDSSLIARKLADVHSVVCVAPSLLAARGVPSHPDELRGWPALCYTGSERPDLWRYRSPEGAEGTVRLQPRLLSGDGGLLRDAAIMGEGVTMQPSFVVHKAVESGELVPVLRDFDWPELAIYAVYPHTRHLSARARAFINFLQRRIGPRPHWEEFLHSE
ncbi:MAG TPA: LysR family transcriptional regulator [Thermohalobaculum sp.]|nr:LysR family transcriptional regulator [Thermohalobaculum sp.]